MMRQWKGKSQTQWEAKNKSTKAFYIKTLTTLYGAKENCGTAAIFGNLAISKIGTEKGIKKNGN